MEERKTLKMEIKIITQMETIESLQEVKDTVGQGNLGEQEEEPELGETRAGGKQV